MRLPNQRPGDGRGDPRRHRLHRFLPAHLPLHGPAVDHRRVVRRRRFAETPRPADRRGLDRRRPDPRGAAPGGTRRQRHRTADPALGGGGGDHRAHGCRDRRPVAAEPHHRAQRAGDQLQQHARRAGAVRDLRAALPGPASGGQRSPRRRIERAPADRHVHRHRRLHDHRRGADAGPTGGLGERAFRYPRRLRREAWRHHRQVHRRCPDGLLGGRPRKSTTPRCARVIAPWPWSTRWNATTTGAARKACRR